MKWISEEDLKKHIIRDNCDEGCGYIDERDIIDMEWVEDDKFIPLSVMSYVLDKIRAEINTSNRGTCDYFIVDRIEEIIDKYKAESEK